MLVLFGPDINLPYMIVSTGHGISQVTCVVEIKHLKKPYIVYRGENILCYTILYHKKKKTDFFDFGFSRKHSKRFPGARFTHRRTSFGNNSAVATQLFCSKLLW